MCLAKNPVIYCRVVYGPAYYKTYIKRNCSLEHGALTPIQIWVISCIYGILPSNINRLRDRIMERLESWYGYYFDANNNASRMIVYMNIQKDKNGDKIITGSGTDVVDAFIIDGRVKNKKAASFTKGHATHSWNYNGVKNGPEMFGTWGTNTK